MRNDMTPQQIFNRIYDILCEHAGARDGDWQREGFVRLFAESAETTEWRFQGLLAFGGKFWRNDGRYYVTCYPEDETAARRDIVEKVNELLKELPYSAP